MDGVRDSESPASARIATICCRKKTGFPRRRRAAPRGPCWSARSPGQPGEQRVRLLSQPLSEMEVARSRTAELPRRVRSASSGLATHTNRTGTASATVATCSSSAKRLGSAQWMSSTAHHRPIAAPPASPAFETPIGPPRRRRSRRRSRPRGQTRAAISSDSVVGDSPSTSSATAASLGAPASARTISATGQYVMPSPYGRHRPTTVVASSATSPSSARTSRDLPIPGAPIRVTSRGSRSAATASKASRRRASSR